MCLFFTFLNCSSIAAVKFSMRLNSSNKESSCGTYLRPCRDRFSMSSLDTSFLPRKISPVSMDESPATDLNNVVLPAPFAPSRPVILLGFN